MPEIELPDGTVLDFPDEMSQDEIRAGVKQYLDQGEAPQPDRQSFGAGMLDSFTQGAAFGFGDELTAAEAATLGKVPGESWRERYDTALAKERGQQKQFSSANPVAAGVGEVAGGIATAMTPVGAVGSAMRGGMTAGNLARGTAAGAGYGAAYGFGEGEGGAVNRLGSVGLSAAAGAIGGAAAVPLAAGAGRLSRALANRKMKASAPDTAGMRPRAYEYLRNAAGVADTSYPGGGAARIRVGGPDAMLADVMPGQTDFVANMGAAAPIARRNLTERVGRASGAVDDALNTTMGNPRGVKEIAREISEESSSARRAAYQQAYETPISYASDAGRNIEEILARVPDRTMREAIEEANESMMAQGLRNQQIMASIADNGRVTFQEMPNVQQLDEIKRALQAIARDNVDQFGRRTARGNRANGLAGELREALGIAAPAYDEAVRLGGDKIAMDNALDLGQRLLTNGVSVEDAVAGTRGLKDAERGRLQQGIRSYVDDLLGRVKATRGDPDVDSREAWKAIQELSGRNNREKLRAALGNEQADAFLGQVDQAARAFQVRAAAAGNSATMPRSAQMQALESGGSVLPQAPVGPPRPIQDSLLSLPGKAVNRLTGNTPAAREARMAADLTELAEKLTGLRGQEAVDLFERLLAQSQALQAMPQGGGRLSQFLRRSPPLAAAPAANNLIQD